MKSILTAIVVAALTLPIAQTAGASEALAKQDGCLNCHAIDTKKVGPAFKDVAAKYKGNKDAEATLTTKIAEGKGHPATKGKPEDVKTIVKWILAM